MSTSILIFGASGDLTQRKLIPALYNEFTKGKLPEAFNIIGISRTEFSHDAFRADMQKSVKEFSDLYTDDQWSKFASHVWYIPADASKPEGFDTIKSGLTEIEGGNANRLYYLSVAPNLIEPIVTNLGTAEMNVENGGWRRIILEKPFGTEDGVKMIRVGPHAGRLGLR